MKTPDAYDVDFVQEMAEATGATPRLIRGCIKRLAAHGAIMPVERSGGKIEWVPNFDLVQQAA